MKKVAFILVALVAILHLYIAWFEMFAWTSRGPQVFETFPAEMFPLTIELAANQGMYNAFLAVGLIWSLMISDPKWKVNVAICFLGFVVVAGITASVTVAASTGLPQIIPAGLALILLLASRRS